MPLRTLVLRDEFKLHKSFLLLFSSTKFSSFYIISVYGQTEAVKDMEAKLEEQEQNKLYLDQLLAMLKDRDPTLLHVINSSLASR